MTDGEHLMAGQTFEFPHCNPDVLHAPGDCVYCDDFPRRQAARAGAGEPYSPLEANGWSGNVAVKEGEEHTHLGATFTAPTVGVEWKDWGSDENLPKPSLRDRIIGSLICPSCLRLRFSPLHFLVHLFGMH